MVARRIRMLFFPNSTPQYITFQNLKFRYSNWTSIGEMGCAVGLNPNCTIRNCDVQWCDFGGIGISNNCVVDGCTASNNGDSGVVVTGATGWVVKNSKMQNNNWRSFNPTWHAGGIKAVAAGTYGRIENDEVSGNYGQGIWLDTCSGGLNVVRNNYVHNNGNGGSVAGQPSLAGIMIENTTSANIENNVVANNSDLIGIYISGSNSTNTFNNTVAYNGISGGTQSAIEVNVDEGSGRTLENNTVKNNIFYNNICDYDLGITTGPTANNIYGNTADYNLYYHSGGSFCCTMDVQDDPTYPYGQTAYTLSSWQALGLDAHGKNANPAFNTTVPTTYDYSLSSTSPARGAGTMGVNLPWDYYWQPRSTSSMDMGAIAYGSGRIYEGESGTPANGAVVYTDAGCSNGARMGNFNVTNASDTWSNFDGASGGDWALTFTYSSASGASKGLYVNGAKVATPSFLNTGGWGSGYQTTLTTTAALTAGTNTVALINDSATNGVDIDKIDAAPAIVTYEAESGTFTGGAGVYADPGCSNGARVGGLSQTNASVTWSNVTVNAAGSHKLTVIYSDAATFNKGLYVNGTKVRTLSLTNTGGVGSAYQRSIQTTVTLNAGANTIAIKNDTNTGPDDIDAIIVSN
jgi:parallel beta-helix repeat protein